MLFAKQANRLLSLQKTEAISKVSIRPKRTFLRSQNRSKTSKIVGVGLIAVRNEYVSKILNQEVKLYELFLDSNGNTGCLKAYRLRIVYQNRVCKYSPTTYSVAMITFTRYYCQLGGHNGVLRIGQ